MERNKEIQNELSAISKTIAAIPFENPFYTPQDYLENLTLSILIKNNQTQLPTIPEQYFENLSEEILIKKRETSLTIDNKNILYVPENYFESISKKIINKVNNSRKYKIKRLSIAIAAVVVGIIGLTVFLAPSNNNGLSEKIEDATVLQNANEIIKNKAFESQLMLVNNSDIIGYLEEDGQDVNAALVASVSDDKNLPAVEEYFYDEETLNNFLLEKNIQIQQTHIKQ